MRQVHLSLEEYKELVIHIKHTFTDIINQNPQDISFTDLDVEDRLISCLRADNPGDKLKRVINKTRENATSTIYKRWSQTVNIEKRTSIVSKHYEKYQKKINRDHWKFLKILE